MICHNNKNLPLNFIKHVFISTSQDDGTGIGLFAALEKDEIIITDSLFNNFFTFTQIWWVEDLFALWSCHCADNCGSSQFGNSLDIAFADSSQTKTACFSHVLWCQIVDTHAGDNDVSSRFKNFSDSFFQDITFLLSDLLNIFWIINQNLDTQLESEFVQVEIKTSDFSVLYLSWHLLMSLDSLDGVTLDQLTFSRALSMSLKDIDRLDGVLDTEKSLLLNSLDWLNNQVSEEGWISVDQLGWHWGLCTVEQCLLTKTFDTNCKLVLNVPARLFGSHLEPGNDICGVDIHLDQLVGSFQQFSSENDNTGGSVSDFWVLQLCQLNKKVSNRVFNLKLLQNSSAFINTIKYHRW